MLYELFRKVLEEALLKLSSFNKFLIIYGGLNITLYERSTVVIRFKSLFKYNLFQEPPRITAITATCNDKIFPNLKPNCKFIINKLVFYYCDH